MFPVVEQETTGWTKKRSLANPNPCTSETERNSYRVVDIKLSCHCTLRADHLQGSSIEIMQGLCVVSRRLKSTAEANKVFINEISQDCRSAFKLSVGSGLPERMRFLSVPQNVTL